MPRDFPTFLTKTFAKQPIYTALNRSAPIRSFQSLAPDRHFLHEVGYINIGKVGVISQRGTEMAFHVEHTPHLHLLAVFGGQITLDTAGGTLNLARQGAALLPTGHRHTQGAHSLASISLAPAQVALAAAAMAGRPPGKAFSPREQFPVLTLPPASAQGQAIHGLLRTIDACTAIGPAVATHLGLDDVILRSAAALLHPALLQEEPADLLRYRDPAGRRSFDALIDYIRAHLDQPCG
ncbi:MAG: hypothetical protein ACKO28_11775 [Cyanobium sp.]